MQANIMKMADGLFLRCCREVHERYPNIQYREMIVSPAWWPVPWLQAK